MKEPLRWLDERNVSPEGALLRAAAHEPLPDRALLHAGQRVGASAALLTASAKAIASQSLAVSASAQAAVASAGTQAALASATTGTTLLFTLGKALTVGLGIGSLLVGTAHWTSLGRSTVTTTTTRPVAVAEQDRTAHSIGIARHLSVVESEPSRLETTAPIVPARSSADVTSPSEQTGLAPHVATNAMSAPSESPRAEPGSTNKLAGALPGLHEPQTRRLVGSTAFARFADEPEAPLAARVKVAPSSETLAPPPPNPPRSTLAQEVRTLDSVREALRAGEARRALDELNRAEGERLFHRLSREAAVLRVEALGALGRYDQAASLARQLIGEGVSPTQRQSLEHWIDSARK